jgi:type II secretory pathway component PulJ
MCMHLAANGLTLSTPPDQLWLVALYLEENGAPQHYILAVRRIAEQLEQLGWWLSEPDLTLACEAVPAGHL